jgi:hypothetical protein
MHIARSISGQLVRSVSLDTPSVAAMVYDLRIGVSCFRLLDVACIIIIITWASNSWCMC